MQEIMNYQQIVEDIRVRIKQTSDNFVYIGWQLKRLIGTGLMQQAGYSSIEELGKAEFGLNKDDTYRFIKINTKYSIGGDSPELNKKYEKIGQSKLSEMLSLPDEDLTLITDKTKREDIRELNRFNKQEPEKAAQEAGGHVQNIITEFFRPAPGREERHAMLQKLLSILEGKADHGIMTPEEQLQECINPKGNATFRSGKYFLFLYEARDGMKYKIFGSDDNHHVSYMEFARTAHLLFTILNPLKEGLDAWESFYGPEPKKEEPYKEEPQKEKPHKEEPQKDKVSEKTGTKWTEPDKEKAKKSKAEGEKLEEKKEEETQEHTQSEPSSGFGENLTEQEESQGSYPQKSAGNAVLAPAQLGTNAEADKEEPVYQLRRDAETCLDKILKAMEENQYFRAKNEARNLVETLGEICMVLDKKQIDGQMEINDYMEEDTDGKEHHGAEGL